ncbi:MAG: D-glycerate dehydrogenase [Acidobacteriota bacterium]
MNKLPKVLVDLPLPSFLGELLTPFCVTIPWDWLDGRSGEELRQVEGVYTYAHPLIDEAFLRRLPALKVVSNFGVGVDHIDLKAAAAQHIPIGNTPGVLDGATADLTLALLLACARNVVVGDRFARSPEFTTFDPGRWLGLEVFGSTLGIVGLGRIGKQVARRARAFDMRVLYHNRRRDTRAEEELGVECAGLNELLEQSHFVSLNLPLTAETTGMIGEAELRRMRPDAILINVARGPVVQTSALVRALEEKWIAGAGLDVTDPEPLPRAHALLRLNNVVLTPHLGSATVRTRRRMGEMAAANLQAGLEGRPLPYAVATE